MISIRTGDAADLPAVLELWAVGAENASRPVDSAEALSSLLVRDPAALLLAFDGDVLVGSVIAGWDGWRAHLYRLAVHPSARRQGVGRALVAAAEERLVALGAVRIDAMVLDGNALGQSVWAATGYARQDDCGRWVKPVLRGVPE